MVGLPHDPRRDTFDARAEALLQGSSVGIDAARAAVAADVGFSGWDALQAYLDIVDVYRRDNDPHTPTETIPDEFCRLACLTYSDDPPERRAAARELLDVHPDLAIDHIWAAAAAADTDALRTLLARNPSLVDLHGGPYGWKPLIYLTYSRVEHGDPILAARLLLRAGADPNAGYLAGGMPTPFTVLTGVFGEGEQGPGQCPRHPQADALGRLLLDAGADPNDGQTLYNRMFTPDNSHLDLLFAYGLGTGDGGEWKSRLGEAWESPREMVDGQLGWAVRHGFADRVALLISHGADVTKVLRDGRTTAEVAAANGDRHILAMVVAAGASVPRLDGLPAYVAALMANDAAQASAAGAWRAAALAAHPDLVVRAVDAGRSASIGLLAELGFDVNARRNGETALHRAAWIGDIDAARALLDAGADPDATDEGFGATPLGWAQQAGQGEFIAFLERHAQRAIQA